MRSIFQAGCRRSMRLAGLAGALLLVALLAHADGPTPVQFALRNCGADEVARMIRAANVDGLEVAGAPGGKTLFASGSTEALKRAAELVKLVDVAPGVVDLRMKVTRTPSGGAPSVLSSPVVRALNGQSASIKVSGELGFEVTVTPRINSDASVTLQALFLVEGPEGRLAGVRRTVRCARGASVRLGFEDRGGQAYTLEISPTPLPSR